MRFACVFAGMSICAELLACESDRVAIDTRPPGESVQDSELSSDTNESVETREDSGSGSASDSIEVVDTAMHSTDTTVCDAQDFEVEFLPVRVMILLDRSGSMGVIDDKTGVSSMMQAKPALLSLLDASNDDIEFGFDIFPDDGDCGVAQAVLTDTYPGNTAAVRAQIEALPDEFTDGSTPLCKGMKAFLDSSYAPNFTSQEATSYLIVVADGGDSCAGTAPCGNGVFPPANFAKLTTELRTKFGIRTFVIGFGDNGVLDSLDLIAAAGGTSHKKYIPASNETELMDAFETITAATISCVYEVDEPSAEADPDKVNFYFDNELVGYDENCAFGKGWTWTDDTHTKVRFCDEACGILQEGSVDNVSAKFGCPTTVVV